jgi:hypothetical protein
MLAMCCVTQKRFFKSTGKGGYSERGFVEGCVCVCVCVCVHSCVFGGWN